MTPTPLIPALKRQMQAELYGDQGQPGLQIEFPDSQSYTQRNLLLKQTKKQTSKYANKQTNKNKQTTVKLTSVSLQHRITYSETIFFSPEVICLFWRTSPWKSRSMWGFACLSQPMSKQNRIKMCQNVHHTALLTASFELGGYIHKYLPRDTTHHWLSVWCLLSQPLVYLVTKTSRNPCNITHSDLIFSKMNRDKEELWHFNGIVN